MVSHFAMRYRVILVPFPFDDLTASKVRPAVCLTEAIGAHGHVLLAFISSVVPPNPEPTDLLQEPSDADFARTGLRVRLALRLHRMVTVSARIIRRQLGVLAPKLQAQVQERLRRLFAI